MISCSSQPICYVRTGGFVYPSHAEQDDMRRLLIACPVCQSRRLHYAFSHQGYRVVRCADCRLLLLNPQPSDRELAEIYTHTYFLGEDRAESHEQVSQMKRATARSYLDQM